MNKLKDKYKQILEDITQGESLSNRFARENLDEIFGLFGGDGAPSSGAMPKRSDYGEGPEGDKAHSDALRAWGGKEKKAAEQQTQAAASKAETLDKTITGLKTAETVIDTGLMIANPALGAALQATKAGVDVSRGDTEAAKGRLIDAGIGLATMGAANLAFKGAAAAVKASPALTSATTRVVAAATKAAPTLTNMASKGAAALRATQSAPVLSTVGKTVSGAVAQTVKAGINRATQSAVGQTVKAGINKVTTSAVGQTVKAGANKVTSGAIGQTVKAGANKVTSRATAKAVGRGAAQQGLRGAVRSLAREVRALAAGGENQGMDSDLIHAAASRHGGEGLSARTNLGAVEGVVSSNSKQVRSVREGYNKTGRKGMKKFKDLQKKLLEDYTEGGSVFSGFANSNPARTANKDFGTNQYGKGDSISRLNAFIHAFLGGTYIDPDAAIKELRSRLNHIGLDFPFDGVRIKLNPGLNTFPVKVYGGVFGTTPTTDLLKNGFNTGEDLPQTTLEVMCSYDNDSCMWTLSGKIKPNGSLSEGFMDWVQSGLDVAGFVPVIGTAADLANSGISLGRAALDPERRGEHLANAAISGVAAIPIAGDAAKAGSMAVKAGTKMATKAGEMATKVGEYGVKKSGKMCEGGDCGGMTSGEAVYQSALAESKKISNQITSTTKHNKQLAGKDTARAIMHTITRDGDIRKKILEPIYIHLAQKKRKGTLTMDQIQRELYYVVNAAQRKKKVSLSKKEKDRVVNDLVRNFRKYASKHSTRQPDVTRRKGKSKNSKKSSD